MYYRDEIFHLIVAAVEIYLIIVNIETEERVK